MSKFNIPEEVDIMLNKQEIKMIEEKIKKVEDRITFLKNKSSIAMLTNSNWDKTTSGKPVYIGFDYDTDIEFLKDYLYLLKRRIILNE